jgi:hypothetical protein
VGPGGQEGPPFADDPLERPVQVADRRARLERVLLARPGAFATVDDRDEDGYDDLQLLQPGQGRDSRPPSNPTMSDPSQHRSAARRHRLTVAPS